VLRSSRPISTAGANEQPVKIDYCVFILLNLAVEKGVKFSLGAAGKSKEIRNSLFKAWVNFDRQR